MRHAGPVMEIATMDVPREEAAFLFRRAEEEAIRAIHTGQPDAAAVHFDMALLYGARARAALTGRPEPLSVMVENRLRQS